MQGYILKVTKAKEENCIVDILTKNGVVRAYRFYGARHPVISQGYKIDFELINNINFIPRIQGVVHLGFSWLLVREKLLFWQQLMRLFYAHLRDAQHLDEFYFDLLDEIAIKFSKQNSKRLIIEAYVKILEYEGRLHKEPFCFICDEEIAEKIALGRAFLPSHEHCSHQNGFILDEILEFYETKKSTNLSDETVNALFEVVLQGF